MAIPKDALGLSRTPRVEAARRVGLCVIWHSETAITTVGKGSQAYRESDDARHAAILHLESILPRPQAKRLLSNQSDLVWEPWFEPRKRRS